MRVAVSALYHTGGWGGLRGIHTLREHKVLHIMIHKIRALRIRRIVLL